MLKVPFQSAYGWKKSVYQNQTTTRCRLRVPRCTMRAYWNGGQGEKLSFLFMYIKPSSDHDQSSTCFERYRVLAVGVKMSGSY
jgi:hypothetical protein